MKRNFFLKSISLVMVFLLLLTSIPTSVFAAVKDVSWDSSVNDLNYDFWELAEENKPKLAENSDGLRVPAVNYRGTYTYKENDGNLREVIRMSFSSANYQSQRLSRWNKFALKLSKDLYNMVDWDNSNTGFYSSRYQNEYSDSNKYSDITKFSDATVEQVGAKNVKVIDLTENNNYNQGARGDIPFQLVLKSGESLEKLKKDPVVQARIYEDFKTVFSFVKKLDNGVTEIPYNYYTLTSSIPLREDYKPYLINDISGDKTNMHSTNTYIRYNPTEGYVDIIYKMQKDDFGTRWFGKQMALFQSFDKSFIDVLKPRDGVAAVVALGNQDDEYWSNGYNYRTGEFIDSHSVKVNYDDINTSNNVTGLSENIAFIKVANKDWSNANEETLQNGKDPKTMRSIGVNGVRTRLTNNSFEGSLMNGASTPNAGLSTIVRWYVDPQKVEKQMTGLSGLGNHTIFNAYVAQNDTKNSLYKYNINLSNDADLKKGDRVTITFPSNVTRHRVKLSVGESTHKVDFSSSIDTSGKIATWTLPFDLHIDKGEKISIFAESGPNITINGPNNQPFNVEGSVETRSGIIDASDALIGGVLEVSYPPKVDEIFTDATSITGYAKYNRAEIGITTSSSNEQLLSANKYSESIKFKEGENPFTYNEYPSYRFNTSNANPAVSDSFKTYKEFNMPDLKKDEPVTFTANNIVHGAVPSDAVIEQVQAKVKFDLNGQTSKIDGFGYIEKIAPLNKEYSYTLENDKYVANKNYTPSGFAKIENNEVVGGENLKIDNNNILTVSQSLFDSHGNKSTLDRYVINYIAHNGNIYDINATDPRFKTEEINKLLKRQFPINEEVNLPNAKRIIGWTTVKLEDKVVNGKTITAEEQYYDLLKSEKIVSSLEQWKSARTEAYIYDEKSPIEKNETVYAVYGGLAVVLHSGNYDESGQEITVRLPITQADIDYTDMKTRKLDGTTSATMIIKDMPKAPYTSMPVDVEQADERLKDFKKDGNTFIGWTLKENLDRYTAGRNNDRINELLNGKLVNGQEIQKDTEGLRYLIEEKESNKKTTKYSIPNGFDLAISSKNFDYNGEYTSESDFGLKTREQLLNTVSEIHLYAIYRPYFNITVNPRYKLIDRNMGEYGEYKDGVDALKQRSLTIGLMSRTAVTGYDKPTVDAAANYNPIGDASTLKKWNPNENDKLTWTLPGYDPLGRRKSYVGVVVPEGKEDIYTSFNHPFTEESWKKLGISTFTKSSGTSLDANAPKNLYRDADPNRDPYGVPLAKIQSFIFKSYDADNTEKIDAYTSATARKSVINNKNEVTGYDIVMTNTLETVPAPIFERVRDTDSEVKLEWGRGKDYETINKIEIYLDGLTYTLTGNQGNFRSNDDKLTAIRNEDKLIVTGLDLAKKGGKNIQAKYFVTLSGEDLSGAIGATRIITTKTSEPVKKIKQVKKETLNEVTKIEFTVPEKTLDQVGSGSIYIAEKWNGTEWIEVGRKELVDIDKIHNMYQGNEYIIELDSTMITHGDKIRVVSYEKNPEAEYSDKLKREDPSLKDGYSKPAYSTLDKLNSPVEGKENTQYVTLDLKGPTGEIKAEDEKFRRFVNIRGKLDEIPDNQEVTLKIGDKQIEFETKKDAINYINQLSRLEDMPDMTIVAKDRFGNVGETDVKYTKTYQTKVYVSDANRGRDFINVTSDMDGVDVTAIIYSKKTEVARGTATVTTAKKNVEMDLKDENGDYYALKRGDRIRITGEVVKEGKKYTSNPFDIVIR